MNILEALLNQARASASAPERGTIIVYDFGPRKVDKISSALWRFVDDYPIETLDASWECGEAKARTTIELRILHKDIPSTPFGPPMNSGAMALMFLVLCITTMMAESGQSRQQEDIFNIGPLRPSLDLIDLISAQTKAQMSALGFVEIKQSPDGAGDRATAVAVK